MPLTIFIAWPVFFAAIAWVERNDRRTAQAREDLETAKRLDKFDRAAAHLTDNDPWAELDQAWLAEFGIAWPRISVSALPMRPVKHSRNRLHRGF